MIIMPAKTALYCPRKERSEWGGIIASWDSEKYFTLSFVFFIINRLFHHQNSGYLTDVFAAWFLYLTRIPVIGIVFAAWFKKTQLYCFVFFVLSYTALEHNIKYSFQKSIVYILWLFSFFYDFFLSFIVFLYCLSIFSSILTLYSFLLQIFALRGHS